MKIFMDFDFMFFMVPRSASSLHAARRVHQDTMKVVKGHQDLHGTSSSSWWH